MNGMDQPLSNSGSSPSCYNTDPYLLPSGKIIGFLVDSAVFVATMETILDPQLLA